MYLYFHPYWQAATGGIVIGLASWLVLIAFGRVTGISGITAGAASALAQARQQPHVLLDWRVGFLIGLIAGGALIANLLGVTSGLPPRGPLLMIAAGLLVGYGTIRGGGCTSGHGVCGLGRRSPRSLIAVVTFMAAAMLTVTITGFINGA
jgi:uncharacterized membrane protein YedE/YeeE